MRKSIKAIGNIGAMTILLCGIYWFVTTHITTVTKNIHVGKTFKSISIDIKELKSETEHIIDMEQVIDFKVNDSGLMLYFNDGTGYYWENDFVDIPGYVTNDIDSHYLNMASVIRYETNDSGLMLYFVDGNGYYWER